MNYQQITIDGIMYNLIPATTDQQETQPNYEKVAGEYCVAYHCPSENGVKKWVAQYKRKIAQTIFGVSTKVIGYYLTREEAARAVMETDRKISAIFYKGGN